MTLSPVLLEDSQARAEVFPDIGGAVGRIKYNTPSGPVPIFRTGPAGGRAGPFESGSNVLVPFANRITNCGFSISETLCELAANVEGEPYPIHGNGFQSRWTVLSS